MRRHPQGRRREEGASVIVVLLALVGCGLIAAAGVIALRDFDYAQYHCGSVISPKDPRDLVSRRANVPLRFIAAHNECESLRSDKSTLAEVLLFAGAVLLVGALAAPAIARRGHRMRRRHRARH